MQQLFIPKQLELNNILKQTCTIICIQFNCFDKIVIRCDSLDLYMQMYQFDLKGVLDDTYRNSCYLKPLFPGMIFNFTLQSTVCNQHLLRVLPPADSNFAKRTDLYNNSIYFICRKGLLNYGQHLNFNIMYNERLR